MKKGGGGFRFNLSVPHKFILNRSFIKQALRPLIVRKSSIIKVKVIDLLGQAQAEVELFELATS